MAVYQVTDPNTGQTLRLEGDSPPTEEELEQIFAQTAPQVAQEAPEEATGIVGMLPPGMRGEGLSRPVGLTARAGVEGVAAIPALVIDPMLKIMEQGVRALGREPNQISVTEAASLLSDAMGLPKPEENEEFGFEVAKGMAAVSPGVGIGRGMAQASGPVTQRVGNILAETPGIQTAAGATGAAGSEIAERMGAGRLGQFATGLLAGGLTPSAFPRQAARQTARTAATEVAEAATDPAELAAVARRAGEGGIGAARARRVLAEEAAPDPKAIEAARRLEIDEFLQPDHVSTNQSFRELSQAVKSIPGSKARAAEVAGYEAIGKRADDLIEEIGGTTDLSQLSSNVKSRLGKTVEDLEETANALYGKLREEIPATSTVSADNLIDFLSRKAEELGGVANLSAQEKTLLKKLSPTEAGEGPTYGLLDSLRRELTAARVRNQGPFKDADTGLLKKLEQELLKDQRVAAEAFDALDIFDAARASVATRKGLESDLAALFGRNLDRSLVPILTRSTKKLAEGDVTEFAKIIEAVPPGMREEIAASGLNAAFGKNARNRQLNFTSYAKWFEGVIGNKQAGKAILGNLPAESRKSLFDLYRVSKGISNASKERITTGRIQAVKEDIQGADNLIGSVVSLARRSAPGAAAEAVTTSIGLPGAGLAAGISSALTKGRPNAMKSIDDLITSQEFIDAAAKQTPEAARTLAKSSAFERFRKALGNPSELTNPEDWILSAIRATADQNQEEQ